MSREIKFRYWNGVTNKMVNDPPMPYKEGWTISQLFSERGWVWMQYTGLKDKNGKEIYEGDIVADRDTSDCVFEVRWEAEKAGYYMPPEFDEEYAFSIAAVTLEVIGNVYENPDLLVSDETQ